MNVKIKQIQILFFSVTEVSQLRIQFVFVIKSWLCCLEMTQARAKPWSDLPVSSFRQLWSEFSVGIGV